MTITVTALSPEDRDSWEQLYRGYAEFYQMPMTPQTLERVWSWIQVPSPRLYALIAKNEAGDAVGLMHYREMISPLRGVSVGFLDDLFVLPTHRGSGVADLLFDHLHQAAKQQGWPTVRWITADNNYRGRAVYDRLADKTQWLTYQMAVT